MSLKDQRQALVDTFINSIYLYDDKVLIAFNYKEGTQTITFEEAAQAASKENGSDLDCFTALKKRIAMYFCNALFVLMLLGFRIILAAYHLPHRCTVLLPAVHFSVDLQWYA